MTLSNSLIRNIRVGDDVYLLPEFFSYTPDGRGGPVRITEVIEPKGDITKFRYKFIDAAHDKYGGGALFMTTEPIDILSTNQLFIAEGNKHLVLNKPILPHL